MNFLFSPNLQQSLEIIAFIFKIQTGIAAVYNTKELESVPNAFDRKNEKLFPSVERLPSNGITTNFTGILPPPNVTGKLHLGHALMITVLDVICRWKQLKGYAVELVPGLDHAGIATQVVVEQQLKKSTGLSRFDIGKEKFIDLVLKWKDDKGLWSIFFFFFLPYLVIKIQFTRNDFHCLFGTGSNIKGDILRMGTIFNWEKEYFTMDEVSTDNEL